MRDVAAIHIFMLTFGRKVITYYGVYSVQTMHGLYLRPPAGFYSGAIQEHPPLGYQRWARIPKGTGHRKNLVDRMFKYGVFETKPDVQSHSTKFSLWEAVEAVYLRLGACPLCTPTATSEPSPLLFEDLCAFVCREDAAGDDSVR